MRMSKTILPLMIGLGITVPFGQVTWQTTHSTNGGYQTGECDLTRGSLKVKVFQAYLDVEEDAEIAPAGTMIAGNDSKTLEIEGNFTLPSGAAITGALLWDGSRVLEGKLLDRVKADSAYESFVERNSAPPPAPHDPLILEALSKDTYRFRIYPSEPGRARHLRLRYQLPPTIGVDGIEMNLQAAIAPLFSSSGAQIPVTFENGGQVSKVIFVKGSDTRSEMVLPRTKLLTTSELAPQNIYENNWFRTSKGLYRNQSSSGLRIIPIDPLRQVTVKTSFPSGTMAGNYLNLYATVTDEVLRGLQQRVEIVVLWKWHNPGTWIIKQPWGNEVTGYVYQAQSQAAMLLNLYQQMGGAGTKLGMLHDDSKSLPHVFKPGSKQDSSYAQAIDYLQQLQGGYVEGFARGIKVLRTQNGQSLTAGINASKARFLNNLKIVKTMYSPETGVIRHLLVVSAGDDYLTDESDMNTEMDKLFADEPITLANLPGIGFSQAGLDYFDAHRTHAYRGLTVSTPWGEFPGLPDLNLNVVVRNAKKSYDFDIACTGGLNITCGSLTFHGKSDEKWNDTLEWEAYDKTGKAIGTTQTVPTTLEKPSDTAVAILWAGSDLPFSEKQELPLGPVYGFVDRWASLLSLKKDSLTTPEVYSDTGVPRISNTDLLSVIPNYSNGDVVSNPKDPNGNRATSIAAQVGSLSDPSAWQLERIHGNLLRVRIPGLQKGMKLKVELFDLMGKRMSGWVLESDREILAVDVSSIHSGLYMMKIQVGTIQGVKRIAL